jgi:hypothetical protein
VYKKYIIEITIKNLVFGANSCPFAINKISSIAEAQTLAAIFRGHQIHYNELEKMCVYLD